MSKTAQRDPASQALVDLRAALGVTQQVLAVKFLDCATTTVSRYESFGPPKGDILLTLRRIAHDHGHDEIAIRFQNLWLKEVHAALGSFAARTVVVGEFGQTGLLVATLENGPAIRASYDFLTLLQYLESSDEPSRAQAAKLFKAMHDTVRAGLDAVPDQISSAMFGRYQEASEEPEVGIERRVIGHPHATRTRAKK